MEAHALSSLLPMKYSTPSVVVMAVFRVLHCCQCTLCAGCLTIEWSENALRPPANDNMVERVAVVVVDVACAGAFCHDSRSAEKSAAAT